MIDINKIYKMLSWKSDIKTQLEGIELAKHIDDLSLLIQPPAEPSVWEQCAKILYEISDDKLEQYLPSLLEWIQDLNWPGALIILDKLKVFNGKKLKKPFIDCFSYANDLNNEEGLKWVDNLSELLDNKKLKTELPKEILETLQKYHHK